MDTNSTDIWQNLQVAASMLVLVAIVGCSADTEQSLIASARSFESKKDMKSAIIQLKTALQRNQNSGEARLLLGEAFLKIGNMTSAAIELERARILKYDENKVAPLLSKTLMATGQGKKLIELYGLTVLKDSAANAELKATMAFAYSTQGKSDLSNEALSEALYANPKNVTALLLQARLAAEHGKVDDALRLVDIALGEEPKRRDAWHLRGVLLWVGKGSLVEAIASFKKALLYDPQYMPAYSALMSLALQTGGIAGFRTQFAEMKKALPTNQETQMYEAQLALIDKNLTQAREGMQQLIRVAPNNIRVLQLAAAVEFESNALSSAETYLTKALQIEPDLPLARRLLATTYLRSGQPGKALGVLRPLLDINRPTAEILALSGEAYLQSGDTANAQSSFLRATKADPSDTKVKTALALTQISQGNQESGLFELEKLASTSSETYSDLALISAQIKNSDFKNALKAIDRLQRKIPDKPMPYQLRGRLLVETHNFVDARKNFEKAMAADSSYFPAIADLAAMDLAEKHPEEAIKRFEQLLVREPGNFHALLALSDLKQRVGASLTEVVNILNEAVKRNPTEPTPRLFLIENYLSHRDTKSALATAQEALAALPGDPKIVDALGRAQMAAGDLQQSIVSFGKAAANQPGLPQSWVTLGEAYIIAHDYSAARRALKKALELVPNLLHAQRSLIQVEIADKRLDEALQISRTIQSQRPKEASGYLLEGDILYSWKRTDLAIAAYRAAMEREPTTSIATGLHALYVTSGLTKDAELLAEKWGREHPNDAGFVFHLGSMSMGQKDFVSAETYYRRVLTIDPSHALALNNVAWLVLKRGGSGALQIVERANKVLPNQSNIMDTLASALAADNQIEKALQIQREIVAKEPAYPAYKLNLAKLLIKSGDRAAARVELERIAKLGEKFSNQSEVNALLNSL